MVSGALTEKCALVVLRVTRQPTPSRPPLQPRLASPAPRSLQLNLTQSAGSIFGAELREVPLCQYELESGCEVATRRPLDLIVTTVPEQLLRHGEVSEVTSSSAGRFDVLVSWSADQIAIVPPNCADASPVARERTFVASRLAR